MKKIYTGVLVILCIVFSIENQFAETIESIQQKVEQSQNEQQQALEKLKTQQLNLSDIVNKVAKAHEDQKNMENEQAQITVQIENTKVDIEKTQTQINNLRDKAGASLVFYQEVDDSNPLIEQVFGDAQAGSESYEKMMATNDILDAGMESIREAVVLQKKLNDTKNSLEVKSVELNAKIKEIESKKSELNILKQKVQAEASKARETYESAQMANVANERLQKLMQDAGCKPGEVYGVDCGKLSSTGAFARPLSYGMVTCEFACYTNHTGIDLGQNGSGGPIFSVADGQIIAAGNGIVSGGGNQAILVHNYNGKQVITSYAHMSRLHVSSGQPVTAQTQLGTVGSTGNAFGPHLHFEISEGIYGWNDGGRSFVNPRNYVSFPPQGEWFNSR